MRRYITILAASMMLAACSSLSMVLNEKQKDGSTKYQTSELSLFGNYSIALCARTAGNDTTLAVLIGSRKDSKNGEFAKNSKLVATLADGSKITLSNIYNHVFESDTVSNEAVNRSNIEYSYNLITENPGMDIHTMSALMPKQLPEKTIRKKSYALYPIGRHQINDVINKGVKELAIETDNGVQSMPDASDATEQFKDIYNFMMEYIRNK